MSSDELIRPAPAEVTAVQFPDGFVWGTATSSYQIEGAVGADGRGPSIWDAFSAEPGRVHGGHTGAVAVDHYNRFAEDVSLMAGLGIGAYRFSIAWSRIVPEGSGRVEPRGLAFYDRLIDSLCEAGIEPVVTLYHWDLPLALQERGGWPSREVVGPFGEYASTVAEAFGDRVRRWATLNEPWCSAFLGHASARHAPGWTDPEAAIHAAHHLLCAHGEGVAALRAANSSIQAGIVLNMTNARAADDEPVTLDAVRRTDGLHVRWFADAVLRGAYPADVLADLAVYGAPPVRAGDMEAIAAPLDWLGINYYNDTVYARATGPAPADAPPSPYPGVTGVRDAADPDVRTDMGWPVTPSGLCDLMVRLDRDYPNLPPVSITENGVAYDDPISEDGSIRDDRRIAYIQSHLAALHEAIAAGVDVRGYFAWSLLDNFEWSEGYAMRFGLVHVDFETLVRTPKASAYWYADVIRTNGLSAT